uniref:RRM domain-containing protein n=1 Tax=Bionectria ochroleuca TaxID=29856 RepID=A0A8H7TJT5_BIOOC
MTEVSATRLYLGNLPRTATKADIEAHFATHGTGEITEVKLMNGFGFIEYKDPMDARDVVPAFHGSDFMGERLTVQFARGSRQREGAMALTSAPLRVRDELPIACKSQISLRTPAGRSVSLLFFPFSGYHGFHSFPTFRADLWAL